MTAAAQWPGSELEHEQLLVAINRYCSKASDGSQCKYTADGISIVSVCAMHAAIADQANGPELAKKLVFAMRIKDRLQREEGLFEDGS